MQPRFERLFRFEAKKTLGLCRVQRSSRLTIWFTVFPYYLTLVTGNLSNNPGQFSNTDFDSRSEIYRLAFVVPFTGEQNAFCCVIDIEELARRRSCSPQNNPVFTIANGINALF